MSSTSTPRGSLALLADRRFGPFFVASLVSNAGNWFQNVAAGIVVFALTGSSTLVGVVSILQFGSVLVLSPYAGALTDRIDRRTLLLAAQVVSAAGAAGLAAAVILLGVDGLPGVWPVFAATAVIGLGYAFGLAAMQALVPALVPPADLEPAIALNSVTFNLARAIGPAIAGAVVATAGAGAAFAVNAASFVPLVVVLAVIRARPVRRSSGDRSVRAGLRYVGAHPPMVRLLVATLVLGVASDPVNTLTPAIADRLGRGELFVGLQVAAFGTGAAVAALTMAGVRRRLGPRRAARAGLVTLGLGIVALGSAPTPTLALAALLVAGAGFLTAVTTLNADLQARVDEDVRGRVMALWGMAFLGSRPLAAVLDGALADLASPAVATAVVALPALVVAIVHDPERGAPAPS